MIRNRLTRRELIEEKGQGGSALPNLLAFFVVAILIGVGVNLINPMWRATVLKLVPGFFALGILGIGIAVTYGSMRDAGVV